MIDKLFCTPIYYCILEPDQKVFDTMLSYAKRKTSSNLHNDAVNYTGDTTGESSIHNHVNFYWLNEQISFHAKEYLKELGSDINSINTHKNLGLLHVILIMVKYTNIFIKVRHSVWYIIFNLMKNLVVVN